MQNETNTTAPTHDVNVMNYKKNTLRDIERRQKLMDEITKDHVESDAVTVDGVVRAANGRKIIGHFENPTRENPIERNNCDNCTKHYSCEEHLQTEPAFEG